MIAGQIRASDERGAPIDPRELDRKAIGKATFKVEATTVTTPQRIQIRKVMQLLGVQAKQGEELVQVPDFIQRAIDLAGRAGGLPPRPERPNTDSLEEIRMSAGNEQLMAIYNRRDELKESFTKWREQADRTGDRWPVWIKLQSLLKHAGPLPEATTLAAQAASIENHRLLLADPDPITPLVQTLTQALRDELNQLAKRLETEVESNFEIVESDPNWQQLQPEQRNELLAHQGLTIAQRPEIKVQTESDIVETLDRVSISSLRDRVVAVPSRFQQVQREAATLMEPEVTFISLPRRTMKNADEIDAWLSEVKQRLTDALDKGPVGVQ